MRRLISIGATAAIAILILACSGLSAPTQAPVIIATFGQPGGAPAQPPGPVAQPSVPPAPTSVSASQLDPGWTTAPCSPAQVVFGVPTGFQAEETTNLSVLWIHSEDPNMGLEFTCAVAENGGTFDTELAYWLGFQTGTQWGPVSTETTAVGQLGWTEGANQQVDHILTAVLGPTQNGHIVHLWAMAPGGDWPAAKEIFLKVLRSAQYAS